MKANVGKRRSVGKGSGGFARVVPLEDYVKLEQLMKPLAVPLTLKTNQSQVRSFLMKVLSKRNIPEFFSVSRAMASCLARDISSVKLLWLNPESVIMSRYEF